MDFMMELKKQELNLNYSWTKFPTEIYAMNL